MNFIFRTISVFVLLFAFSQLSSAQCIYDPETNTFKGPDCPNAVQTAVPFLRISADARTGALGDIGVAISPDANSVYYNASKLAYVEKDIAFAVNYTPWLRDLVKDIYLAGVSGYKKLDDMQSIGFGLRYFNMGEIEFVNPNGEPAGFGRPNEFDVSLAYARKLSDKFAIGVTGRFIYSNLAGGQTVDNVDIKAGTAGAVDLSMFYNTDIKQNQDLSIGLALTNMGAKVSYTETGISDYIPANFGLGASWGIQFDDYNRLNVNGEINKLMVPTPSETDDDGDGIPDFRQYAVVKSIFTSFGDAETGKEELKEFTWALGLEYWYNEQFAVRGGYFHEAESKGDRQHFTLGLGLKYQIFGLDLSYLISANGNQNPLNNTLRFTLRFDFDALRAENVEE
jgi:hypothetical protein